MPAINGVQTAWLTVGLSLAAFALTGLLVPHAATPRRLPLPYVDRGTDARPSSTLGAPEAARADLPEEVRAVGEAYRQLTRLRARESDLQDRNASASNSSHRNPISETDPLRSAPPSQRQALAAAQLRRLSGTALKRWGLRPLLELRNLQAERLRLGLRGMPAASERDVAERDVAERDVAERDVAELGGALLEVLRRLNWSDVLDPSGDLDDLTTLFHVHWTQAVDLTEAPGLLSANQWRRYYHIRLSHAVPTSQTLPMILADIASTARYDPTYPVHLARGIALLGADQPAAAAAELNAHFHARLASTRWTLRARNFLAECGLRLTE